MSKERMREIIKEVWKIAESENVRTAKIVARDLAIKWENEVAQMMDDEENRIIFAISVLAALLVGFLIGIAI
jgi:hypothetical protein